MKTHISLNVSNIQESIEFYSKMLGISPFKVKSDYAKFDVANPPFNLINGQIPFRKRRFAFTSRFAGRINRRCFGNNQALE